MSHLKLIIPAALVLGGCLICTTASYGKAEYSKSTKKACTFCHAKSVPDKAEMQKNLTTPGKYYQEHKSLDGYQDKK